MAKSIRSKRMRKLRAFKRIRNGEKELERLKKMIAAANPTDTENVATDSKNISIDLQINPKSQEMETENKGEHSKENEHTQKYPCWLSHFKVRKLAKQERRNKRKAIKRLKKEKKLLETKKKKRKKKNVNI